MKKRCILLNAAVYAGVSLSIVTIVYFVNVLFLSSSGIVLATEALFIEGVLFLIVGLLLLLGRGGVTFSSIRAALLLAATEAVYGTETVGPAEQMRMDSWKSKGFTRAGFILLISGLFMIIVYFLTL